MTTNCDSYYFVDGSLFCFDIAAANDITLDEFYSYNPAMNGDCSGLLTGFWVCVAVVQTTTTTSSASTTTSSGNGVATPTPIQVSQTLISPP